MLSAAFDDALLSKDYQRAIEAFSAYREMPDRLDTQKTIGMELKLSNVCVKNGSIILRHLPQKRWAST